MAVVPIPASSIFSYNKVAFPVFTKTKLKETATFSNDNRTIKFSKIDISVSGFFTQNDVDIYNAAQVPPVAAGIPLDVFMLSIRRKLQVAGRALYYCNRGYGNDLIINDPTNQASLYDVAMGPRPGEFTWWSLGGAPDGCHGAGFEFSISTSIPECGMFPANPGPNVFVEISYSAKYDVDEAGMVVITTTGTAQIPLSLRGSSPPRLLRTVDDCILNIIRPVPVGFIRKSSRDISPDRSTCSFTIVDTQKEVPPPPQCVHIDMKERLRQKARYAPIFVGTISGTVRLEPGAVKAYAWQAFMNLASYRIALARWNCQHPGDGVQIQNRAAGNVLPGTIEFEEDLFKNESRFSINFDILGARWSDIVKLSGMWTPIINPVAPDANMLGDGPGQFRSWTWAGWTDSLRQNAQKFKGILGATFNNATDVIIDICNTTTRGGVQVAGVYDAQPDDITKNSEKGAADLIPTLSPSVLNTPDDGGGRFDVGSTWLEWRCMVERITNHNVVRHKPLAGSVTYTEPPADPFGPAIGLQGDTSTPTAGWTATEPDTIQQISAPSMMIRLRGIGVRIGYRVNAPKMISFGGVTPVLANEWIGEETMGAQDACIYKTEWQMDYLIPTAPKSIPVMADPLLGTDSISGNGSQATGDLGGTDGLLFGAGDGGNPTGLIMAH